jgi:arabinogalactan oligomer/maltooligosaccharide transport system permease protein
MGKRSIPLRIAIQALLVVIAVSVLIPFVYIVLISFGKNVTSTGAVLPDSYTLDNYRRLFSETQFPRWILNSILLALASMLLGSVLCSSAAYVFGRFRFAGKRLLYNLVLLLQIFPLTLSMISINKIFQALGLLNKLPGLVLIDSTMAAAGLVFVAVGYVYNVPESLDEAAMMDGANRFQIFLHILLPLLRPMFVFVCIQSFVTSYNEYVIASVVMNEGFEKMPLAVGLQSLIAGQYGTNWSVYCAGAVLGSIPMLVLFYLLQRHYISGNTEGGVKE